MTIEDVAAAENEAPANFGSLGIPYLFQYWQRKTALQTQPSVERGEWDLDNTLLAGLGLNLLETCRFLNPGNLPDFDRFEEWILATNGDGLDEARLQRLREALEGRPVGSPIGSLDGVPGLTAEELAHWEEHGYVVVHDAVPCATRDEAANAIYEFLGVDPANSETWYGNRFGHSIWVPLLRHPAFVANRHAPRLVKAFAQLWGREDLWPNVDQAGFNPPERAGWRFPGPHLHWDMTIAAPHCFGVQGILYLTDTPAEQGAFSCIPGFHRILPDWLRSLPASEDPRKAIFRHPDLMPIAGKAGDLVIWHQALPHCSSPNRGRNPRVAQYLTLRPTRWPYTAVWK
jgi:hypothetical protein